MTSRRQCFISQAAVRLFLAVLFGFGTQGVAQDLDLRGDYVAVSMAALEKALATGGEHHQTNSISLGFTRFSAAIIQKEPPDIILVGTTNGSLKPLSADDIATLVRSSESSALGNLGISLELKGDDIASKKLVPRFIGAHSKKVAYGNNRADFTTIAGGVVPGLLLLKPDYLENKDDWPFFWGENECIIDGGAWYVFLSNAVNELQKESK